jgi:NAD+ synthase (glutamine-hydrolysing)
MRLVRIGIASVNTTVGAFRSNMDRVLAIAHEMRDDDVTVGVFPEQVIGGYPVEDLVQWRGFVDRQWTELERFASDTAGIPTVFVLGVTVIQEGLRYNCAALVAGGTILGLVPKEKLPTYNVFYEGRTFSQGVPYLRSSHRGVPFGDMLFAFDFGLVAAEVCEDLWSVDGPIRRRTFNGAELVLNVSASPFRTGVVQTRREMISTRASDHQCTIAYTNAVGANDGLVFDGGGYVVQNGTPMLDAPRFREGFATVTVDLDRTSRLRAENTTWRLDRELHFQSYSTLEEVDGMANGFSVDRSRLRFPIPAGTSYFLPPDFPRPSERTNLFEDLLDALAMGVGDYFEKSGVFKKIGVSLSGGRDSLLTLLIAHRYAQKARPEDPGSLLQAFTMPSRFSSTETQTAAHTICRELGIPIESIAIEEAFDRELAAVQWMLAPGETVTELTKQNIQARIRAQRMWNWSNSASGLFLQTGNMSEKAVGYTTIGGDLMGALGVLANVPKTVVMALLEYIYEKEGYEGIRQVTSRPAGPELAPNQKGEDELMPFPILDACFHLFAAEKLLPEEVAGVLHEMFPELPVEQVDGHVRKFTRLFVRSIYKWVQSPISLHIGHLDLDRERALQLPVISSDEWLYEESPPPA